MDPEAPDGAPPSADDPSVVRWVLGFLLVGMAWGLTTPFIRKAAVSMKATPRAVLEDPATGWLKKKMLGMAYTVLDMLRNPRYSVPLLVNITGSIWFFLLIGQAGEMREWTDKGTGLINAGRAEPDGANHQLAGVHVHCSR